MTSIENESVVLKQDVLAACQGDRQALSRLFSKYSPRLERMINLRLDANLQARIGADDILQETYCEALRRLPEYAADQRFSFFLWLRFLSGEQLINARRYHLGTQKRSAEAEVQLHRGAMPQVDTVSLARQLVGKFTSPSVAALRSEMQDTVQQMLNEMDPIDREIIVLRHFEHLSNNEAAQLLGLHKAAASKRYVTALRRLTQSMSAGSK